MNRKKVEQELSAMMDGELSPRRRARLERELARDASLADLRDRWEEQRRLLRAASAQPTLSPGAAWQEVRRAIRLDEEAPRPAVGMPWWQPAAGVMALLLVALGIWLGFQGSTEALAAGAPEVEWVDSDLPGAMSMVYVDGESGWTVIWVDVEEEAPGQGAGEARQSKRERA